MIIQQKSKRKRSSPPRLGLLFFNMSFHMSGSPPLLGFYACASIHPYCQSVAAHECMASHSSAFSAFAVRCTSGTQTFREAAGIRKLRMMEAPNRPPRHMGFRWPAAEKNRISFAGLSLERCRGRET